MGSRGVVVASIGVMLCRKKLKSYRYDSGLR